MKKYILCIYSLLFIFRCELFEPEQEEPTVKITSPKNNSSVCEIVNITAEADDNKGIVYVEFYIDGETGAGMRDFISPYSYEWDVNNLPDSSDHTIYAKAMDTDDNISSSKLITVMINRELGIPEPVELEASISPVDSSVVLEWSQSSIDDFNFYSIYRDTEPGVNLTSDHLVTINQDTVNYYRDENALDNTTYYYVVYLFDRYGHYSVSNEFEISIPNKAPESIRLFNPTNVTDSTMQLTWDKSQDHDFQKYSLFRSLSSNPDQSSNLVFETEDINQNSYLDIGLEKGQIYHYRVFIYNSGELFSMSNVVFDTAKIKISPIPTEGLVAYYPFNGNADDESGNENNGDVNGALLSVDRFGTTNACYEFDGNDDYIAISYDEDLIPFNITVSAWVYMDNYLPDIHLWSIINNGTFLNKEAWELLIRKGESNLDVMVQFDYRGINGEAGRVCAAGLDDPSYTMELNKWYHVVGQYDSNLGVASIYCNGVHIKSVDGNPGPIQNNTNDFRIGYPLENPAGNRHCFDGKIDDIRIYNRALSSSEIDSLYHEKGWE